LRPVRRRLPLICVPLCALSLSACARAVSTSGFKGEQHEVAQSIANLQSDATTGEEKKICSEQLAAAVVERLGGLKGCEKAIKNQLEEIDSLELTVESVHTTAAGKSATAKVKSVYEGKKQTHTVTLVKEGKDWKVSQLSGV
jgi:hypothetical protein